MPREKSLEDYDKVYEYIEENGGDAAFEPTQNPDSYLELMSFIALAHSNGNQEAADLMSKEYLTNLADYYLGIESEDGEELFL